MSPNLYDVLGVAADATPEEIHAAYRQKAKTAHPDAGGSPDAFANLSQAHKVLSDERLRELYDRTGRIDDGPDNDEGNATQIIEGLLGNMLEDENAIHRDIVAELRAVIYDGIARLKQQEAHLQKRERQTLRMLKRFRTKRKKDIVGLLLNQKLAKVRDMLSLTDQGLRAHNRAIEILLDYEFDPEEMPDPFSQSLLGALQRGGFPGA